MKIDSRLTDDAVLGEIGQRIARLRLAANLSQAELARRAGIGRGALQRLEAGAPVGLVAVIRVARTLDVLSQLEAWLPEQALRPMEALRLGGRTRRRATGNRHRVAVDAPSSPWEWEQAKEGDR
jgi:transcriptional regulator with XRE-family HTH domain